MSNQTLLDSHARFNPWLTPEDVAEYWTDALQRSVLFLDVMRERGEHYAAHNAKTAPHVLKFEAQLVVDGRKLPRPVNYVLARIVPPRGVEIDARKRPFVVVDPRAGHGPGIGGFKAAQRDRRCSEGGPPLLLHRLPARASARADDRGHRARRGSLPGARDRAASGRRGQTGGDRQLPGRLGHHDGGRAAA